MDQSFRICAKLHTFATFQRTGLLLSCNGNSAGSGFREFGGVVAHVGRSSPQDLKQSVYGDASKASCLSLLMRRLDLFCQPGGRCLLLFGQAAMDA